MTPLAVFAATTGAVIWVQRHELLTAPGKSVGLLLAIYAFAAWFVWKPWHLKIADLVEETGDTLLIRRRGVEVTVRYADIQSHEFLLLNHTPAVKLTFVTPNALGTAVAFYLDGVANAAGAPDSDSGEYLERQLERYRHGRATRTHDSV